MKQVLFPFLLIVASVVSGQKIITSENVTDHSIHIIGDNFEGIILKDNYFQNPKDTAETKIKRYTPSTEDILRTEIILKHEKRDKQNKGDKKYIFNNLKKYRRQYIGYFNIKGEKCIYVNCFPVDEDWAMQKAKQGTKLLNTPRWYNSMFEVLDGGNSFWQVHINLDSKKIIDMSVNGVA